MDPATTPSTVTGPMQDDKELSKDVPMQDTQPEPSATPAPTAPAFKVYKPPVGQAYALRMHIACLSAIR